MANLQLLVTVICVIFFASILMAQARLAINNYNRLVENDFPINDKIRENFISLDEDVLNNNIPFERNYRSTKKIIGPRNTRMGVDLFTARGFGKRSYQPKMGLLTTRNFGKRNEGQNDKTLLCAITKCNSLMEEENLINNLMEQGNRNKEPQQDFVLAED